MSMILCLKLYTNFFWHHKCYEIGTGQDIAMIPTMTPQKWLSVAKYLEKDRDILIEQSKLL